MAVNRYAVRAKLDSAGAPDHDIVRVFHGDGMDPWEALELFVRTCRKTDTGGPWCNRPFARIVIELERVS